MLPNLVEYASKRQLGPCGLVGGPVPQEVWGITPSWSTADRQQNGGKAEEPTLEDNSCYAGGTFSGMGAGVLPEQNTLGKPNPKSIGNYS